MNGNSSSAAPRRYIALILGAAILMGLPTLRGGFVGGDDHRLALDHVFVNHPSWEHAVSIFRIIHRDLYQPLPLLSFQLEFVVVDLLGLKDRGPDAFAWLFHLDNILLHAINSLLVYFLVRAIHRSTPHDALGPAPPSEPVRARRSYHEFVPVTVGLFFAIHPFQTETVAWLNGRMMLLSTLFLLLGLLAQVRWKRSAVTDAHHAKQGSFPGLPLLCEQWMARLAWGAIAAICFLCCNISKVRVEIPILMLVVAWAMRAPLNRRFASLWIPCAVLTASFAWLNINATAAADLFAGGEEHLKGPRLVRVVLALAFYFQHFVWPTGLASYYPTPPVVSWFDAATLRASLIVAIAFSLMFYFALRSRSARLGAVWFFAAIAATLPFVPARNILAADRYMYIPIIGLLWLGADALAALYHVALDRLPQQPVQRCFTTVAATVSVTLIGICWYTGWFYEDPVKKTFRVAMLYPDEPRAWERVGWAQFDNGDYEHAVESANLELRHPNAAGESGALQLLGMIALRQGRADEALRLLHRALEIDSEGGLARTRLAAAYDELGRPADALPYLETEARESPMANPTLHRLASVYRRLARPDDARRCYEQELRNNAYEWQATVGLVELDLQTATPDSLKSAERRLLDLLAWMPDNVVARVNLGVVFHALGRTDEAIGEYRRALAMDLKNATAAINLAQLLAARDDSQSAATYFALAADAGASTFAEAAALVDFFVSREDHRRAATVADDFAARFPRDPEAVALTAWVRLLHGDTEAARRTCANTAPPTPALRDARAGALPPLPPRERGRGEGSSDERAIAIDADSRTATSPLEANAPAGNTVTTIVTLAPMRLATCAYLAFSERRFLDAAAAVRNLDDSSAVTADARRRLLSAFERFDRTHPDEPWTFCLTAELLLAGGQRDAARASADLCAERCRVADCTIYIEALRARMPAP